MSKSPIFGFHKRTIYIASSGCLLTIILLIIGIGIPAGSDKLLNLRVFDNLPLNEEYIEEEGPSVDLLGSENVDSDHAGENQQTDEMQDTDSEFAGIILQAANEFEGGYASLEWNQFLHIEAGSGYSPAQAEASPVYFDLKLDLGEGNFSGSASGDLFGRELTHNETGNFSVTDISGELRENPQGPGYALEGKGTLNCEIEMEENFTDGQEISMYIADRMISAGRLISQANCCY